MDRRINYDQCYQILNLRSGASLAEIKQRYRELARRYHPDTAPPAQREQATLQFQQINAAKEVLEAYWEQQHSAPPSMLHQRFQEARHRHEEAQHRRAETVWRPRTEPPRPPQSRQRFTTEAQNVSRKKHRHTAREISPVPFIDRTLIVLIAEISIFLILWFGYHNLKDLHTILVGIQTHTANDLMFKVAFGLLVFAVVGCGYFAGIALILLAFLLLFVSPRTILRILSSRRKRPSKSFLHPTQPFSSRRKR